MKTFAPAVTAHCKDCDKHIRIAVRELTEQGYPDCPNCHETMVVNDRLPKTNKSQKTPKLIYHP